VPEAFRDAESYAATAAHELTHWTAHPNRLNRDFGGRRFGDTGYVREELVAELCPVIHSLVLWEPHKT
jgi:antirestriction protein ArdC